MNLFIWSSWLNWVKLLLLKVNSHLRHCFGVVSQDNRSFTCPPRTERIFVLNSDWVTSTDQKVSATGHFQGCPENGSSAVERWPNLHLKVRSEEDRSGPTCEVAFSMTPTLLFPFKVKRLCLYLNCSYKILLGKSGVEGCTLVVKNRSDNEETWETQLDPLLGSVPLRKRMADLLQWPAV